MAFFLYTLLGCTVHFALGMKGRGGGGVENWVDGRAWMVI